MGVARSVTGEIQGPWIHDPDPIFSKDGGHGMLFHRFDGQLMVTLHQPNQTGHERPVFFFIQETNARLSLYWMV